MSQTSAPARRLRCIDTQRYGGTPTTSINRHSERHYRDEATGERFVLSRALDVFPRVFEAYGPFDENFRGVLPSLPVGGRQYWGEGLSWPKAEAAFLKELNATLVTGGSTRQRS